VAAQLLGHLVRSLPGPGRPHRPPAEQTDRHEHQPEPPAVGDVADQGDADDDEQRDAPAVAVKRFLGEDPAVPGGNERPRDEVGQAAEATDEEQDDEGTAHDQRVDPQPVGDSRAHAGQPAVVGVASHPHAAQRGEGPVEGGGPGGPRRREVGHDLIVAATADSRP